MLWITWSLIFLIPNLFGWGIYKASGSKLSNFRRQIKYASIWNIEDPEGWISGKWYRGFIHKNTGNRGDSTNELYIFCSREFFRTTILQLESTIQTTQTIQTTLQTTHNNSDNTTTLKNQFKRNITFWEREGNGFWNIMYCSRMIQCLPFTFKLRQQEIIEKIYADFTERLYSVVLIYGKPGTGKSIIPLFLADYMLNTVKNNTDDKQIYEKVHLVDTFKPTEPGDTFSKLYTRISPTKTSPMICVLEEIDIQINALHNEKIPINREIPTLITCKTDWNQFLDRFDRRLYPHVIFIMTTNKPIEYFDAIDPSYMRGGRVNLRFEM
jgi:Cdc6-like AAA superfamily ATPase